jgi:hypothetical protein
MSETKGDRLYALACDRLERRRPGLGMPILWHLALRRYDYAMILLSQKLDAAGRIWDPFSSAGLAYRAYRQGHPIGAQNLAMDCFNRGDLCGYRGWLRRAARLGDVAALGELRRFEVRLPHCNARRIGRKRPHRSYDG